MKSSNLVKIITLIMVVLFMVMFITGFSYGASNSLLDDDGLNSSTSNSTYGNLTDSGNSSSSNKSNNTSSNKTNNTSSNKTNNTSSNNSSNRSVYNNNVPKTNGVRPENSTNNSALPKTGLGSSAPIVITAIILVISAGFAYFKIGEYKGL